MGTVEKRAQNGCGIKRSAQKVSECRYLLAARIRTLCAIAIVSLLGIATSALAESPAEGANATLKVYVLRNIIDGRLNLCSAQKVVSHIFAEAGVRIKWQFGEPRPGEQHMPIIIDLSSSTPETLAPGALAFAKVYEGIHISVFLDRIQNTIGDRDRLGTFLLAHVMAHEIAHILEGVKRHSATGLMKAHWTRMEIEEMSVRSLSLAPEDVRLIHNSLLK